MMKSTTEFRIENADFLEKLKIADIVICMDKSKIKDYYIDNNICNYLQKCYFADIYIIWFMKIICQHIYCHTVLDQT